MNNITKETRNESYLKIQESKDTRQENVLKMFREYGDMTARDCMEMMGFTDGNCVKPRITELVEQGRLKAKDKCKDPVTNRTVAVFTARV